MSPARSAIDSADFHPPLVPYLPPPRVVPARTVSDGKALAAAYEEGRARRRTGPMELGQIAERTAAVFTVTVSQRVPAVEADDMASHLLSTLSFTDTPGAERLAADPELLRVREGVRLNQGMFALRDVVRSLSAKESADPFALSAVTANYAESKLTLLLSEALGGNALTAVIATVRHGEGDLSAATLALAAQARGVVNAPAESNDRLRRLQERLRHRIEELNAQQEGLAERIQRVVTGNVPAELPREDPAELVAKARMLAWSSGNF